MTSQGIDEISEISLEIPPSFDVYAKTLVGEISDAISGHDPLIEEAVVDRDLCGVRREYVCHVGRGALLLTKTEFDDGSVAMGYCLPNQRSIGQPSQANQEVSITITPDSHIYGEDFNWTRGPSGKITKSSSRPLKPIQMLFRPTVV